MRPSSWRAGRAACNAEPLADFIDLFMLGEGEVQLPQVCDAIIEGRKKGLSRAEILRGCAQIEGVYVPSLYTVQYEDDGRVRSIDAHGGAPAVVRKAIIRDLNSSRCRATLWCR